MEVSAGRLNLLRESGKEDRFYSIVMNEPEDTRKVYLIEIFDDYFLMRSDLLFNKDVERFFYVTKEHLDFSEENLKYAIMTLKRTENVAQGIFAKLSLRGFYSKIDFIKRLIYMIPSLEWVGNTIKDRKSGKVFITIKEDTLHFVYRDGKTESYMDLVKKDFNEKILMQITEMINASLKYMG
ncbi:hypothetical protein AGMMS49938_01700 [Fibrobacterales bacterium]|nr:hypothetical protein AGMMS49938_01680 [Fibrobacterales bacterium]GHV11292.1 hypothetical protein AGMMS49938_01700 [Fibrobacterales bacterium]